MRSSGDVQLWSARGAPIAAASYLEGGIFTTKIGVWVPFANSILFLVPVPVTILNLLPYPHSISIPLPKSGTNFFLYAFARATHHQSCNFSNPGGVTSAVPAFRSRVIKRNEAQEKGICYRNFIKRTNGGCYFTSVFRESVDP
ncbi:hypothetical protein EVAR_46140_1 [Eumeta japonica]|uniref:Uncharacterized protein n=1 Tax=Eumeta variegata TaxID=151549 RepID=A0A4C1XRD6_EUMVA|nr:hypothetical protein EVAR_46140_1 [Eumeta japonica]